jgi:hypothetical protein
MNDMLKEAEVELFEVSFVEALKVTRTDLKLHGEIVS